MSSRVAKVWIQSSLFEGAPEALDAAVALGGADEGGAGVHAEEAQLGLEGSGDELGAVAVPQLQACGDGLVDAAEGRSAGLVERHHGLIAICMDAAVAETGMDLSIALPHEGRICEHRAEGAQEILIRHQWFAAATPSSLERASSSSPRRSRSTASAFRPELNPPPLAAPGRGNSGRPTASPRCPCRMGSFLLLFHGHLSGNHPRMGVQGNTGTVAV